VSDVQGELASFQRELHEYQHRYNSEHARASVLEAEAEGLRKALLEAQRAASKLTLLQVEIEDLNRQLAKLQGELAADRKSLSAEKRSREQLQIENESLRHKLLAEEAARIDAERERDRRESPVRASPSRR